MLIRFPCHVAMCLETWQFFSIYWVLVFISCPDKKKITLNQIRKKLHWSLAHGNYVFLCCKFLTVDLCAETPCRNGGTCIQTGAVTLSCQCVMGYSGPFCQSVDDECLLYAPCQNGATCRNTPESYVCTCPDQYTGQNCEYCKLPMCLAHVLSLIKAVLTKHRTAPWRQLHHEYA